MYNKVEPKKNDKSNKIIWWECKIMQALWKIVCHFLKKLKAELPCDLVIPLLVYTQKN